MRYFMLITPIALTLVICSCTQLNQADKKPTFLEKWQQKALDVKLAPAKDLPNETVSAPAKVTPDKETPKTAEKKPEANFPKTLVTVKFVKENLSTVLRALAKIAKLNIIVDDSLTEAVTMDLENVPWDEVFINLLDTHSLEYTVKGQFIKIQTPESIRKKLALEQIKEQLNQAKMRVNKSEQLAVSLIKIRHLDVERMAQIMKRMLQSVTQTKGKSSTMPSVEVNKETNTIVLNARPSDIAKMKAMIAKLDKPATQVLIEAQIVITNQRTARQLGMQWGGVLNHRHTWGTSGSNSQGILNRTLSQGINPTSGTVSNFPGFPDSTNSSSNSNNNSSSSNNTSDMLSNGLRLGLAYADSNMILSAQLSALEGKGEAQILSSPTITTLDNVRAFIESGSEIPYQSSSQNQGTNTEFKKAVLRLDVTPHVIDGKLIKLQVETNNDEADRSNISDTQTEPAITTRKTKTTVLLQNGQTTVIAGLSKEYHTKANSGVPFLKDIPWLGRLFRSDSRESEMTDLIIFITPHIVGLNRANPSRRIDPKDKQQLEEIDRILKEEQK